MHVRDWLHVDDHCDALMRVIATGQPGQMYNIGGHGERPNIDVVHAICDALDRARPAPESYRGLITHVTDRPGHDRRYALDASKLERELGWRPAMSFETGLSQTVAWYLDNAAWCEEIKRRGYQVARMGLGRDR
jgi:dTDP-glucose 4,6-dehydratase